MSGIEGLSWRNLISSANYNHSTRLHQRLKLCGSYRRISTRKLPVTCSKASDYPDFQAYARPLRLLPITEPNVCTSYSLEEMSTSLREDLQSVYLVKLYTSTMSGSGLSDVNAGILLCVIDENGDSILQRISSTSVGVPVNGDLPELCFQRGSVDEFIFKGPKLGSIQSLWVGLESGRWRLGGVSLTIAYRCEAPSNNNTESDSKANHTGLQYGFEADDISIGEVEGTSMVELKPCNVTELSGDDILKPSHPISLLDREASKQESMKEYANLKSSLLLYDSILIIAGTSIAAISGGEKEALAFSIGGVGGFLYLLLLQKSVDGLPAPSSISTDNNRNIEEGPILSLALALALAFAGVVTKYGSGVTLAALTPKEILVGMTGFLACKIAVLLAAFKPVHIKPKEIK